MKTVVRLFIFIFFAGALSACGSSDGADKRGRVGDRNARNNGNRTSDFTEDLSGSLSKWGQVYRDYDTTGSQTQFQERVMKLVSSNMDPFSDTSGLGSVSGELGGDTGIYIAGDVRVEGGFGASSVSARIRTEESAFAMVVWDSYASRKDSNGDYIGGWGFSQDRAVYGEIQGNRAVLEWEDEYGHIWLDGYFDNQYFEGYIYFENHYSEANEFRAQESELLGRFFVPTCEFFRCN